MLTVDNRASYDTSFLKEYYLDKDKNGKTPTAREVLDHYDQLGKSLKELKELNEDILGAAPANVAFSIDKKKTFTLDKDGNHSTTIVNYHAAKGFGRVSGKAQTYVHVEVSYDKEGKQVTTYSVNVLVPQPIFIHGNISSKVFVGDIKRSLKKHNEKIMTGLDDKNHNRKQSEQYLLEGLFGIKQKGDGHDVNMSSLDRSNTLKILGEKYSS